MTTSAISSSTAQAQTIQHAHHQRSKSAKDGTETQAAAPQAGHKVQHHHHKSGGTQPAAQAATAAPATDTTGAATVAASATTAAPTQTTGATVDITA